MNIEICADTSILEQQIGELADLLRLEPLESLELLKSQIFSDSGSLLFDVVVCEGPATPNALGANEVFIGLRFGRDFEGLVAALRAGKLNGAHGRSSTAMTFV